VKVSLVAALSRNRVIGARGGIPWRLPDDQRFFKQLTTGHCLVMGRATFESIGRLLPGRTTLILSRQPDYRVAGARVLPDLDAALGAARAADEDEVFVVGGATVYAEALARADRLYLTRVDADVEGDVLFPDFDAIEAGFELVEEQTHPADARHAHAFTIQRWERRQSEL
jgi:dihydrofolate reductase